MASPPLGFGVEIEAFVQPFRVRQGWNPFQYYEVLAMALRNRSLRAMVDNPRGGYRKHPEHYDKWFITTDGSLPRSTSGPNFSLEIVSPKLTARGNWEREIDMFWEAMRKVFRVHPDTRCGSHIHVAPVGRPFTLRELKKIAFAVCYYEPCINAILPPERQNNRFCKLNSRSTSHLGNLIGRKTPASLRTIATEIKAMGTASRLCSYMQADRYVLWNFDNTTSTSRSGTVEFRGGRHLRGTVRTKRWIAFTLAFVTMALHENLVNKPGPYLVPRPSRDGIAAFWSSLRHNATILYMGEHLPYNFTMMRDGNPSRAPPQRASGGGGCCVS